MSDPAMATLVVRRIIKATPERVTVRFDRREGGTEIIIVHERIPNRTTREPHEKGMARVPGWARGILAIEAGFSLTGAP